MSLLSAEPVVLATRNAHKVAELRRILAPYDIPLVGLEEFPSVGDVAETGATFAENALLKAHAVASATGRVTVADDSGLAVDALNGMPGVLSARWCGRHGDDAANLDLVIAQIVDVPEDRRGASFVCAAAAVTPDGRQVVEEGRVVGRLAHEAVGVNGFGYDPIFLPVGETRTFAQMSADEKDALSHRARAFQALALQLPALLGAG